jgi:hypothetical protein
MILAARIFLFLSGTLLLAHYLPSGYWLITGKQQRPPFVFYSCIEKRFLLMRSEKGEVVRTDTLGKTYDRDEFETLLPLDNYMQLYKDQRMPKEIDGIAITPEKLRRDRLNIRVKPESFDSPSVPLYTLFEAESGRTRLEVPEDVMRLGNTIEFVNVKQNQVVGEKSARFQQAFAGFKFPAKIVASNPSALKPYDEGFYLVDATGAFFHLRQVHGNPELTRIVDVVPESEKQKWTDIKPRYIHVQEQDNREVRALILDQSGKVFLVLKTDYRLIPLPLEHYDPDSMALTVRGDILNRLVSANSRNSTEVVVLNRNYEYVDRYVEELQPVKKQSVGRLAGALFPFSLEFESTSSGFLGFHFAPGNALAIVVNLVLALIFTTWYWFKKRTFSWNETAWIILGGIYGLILAFVVPKSK